MNDRTRRAIESIAWPVASLAAAMLVFGIFVATTGRDPLEMYGLIYDGAFADAFAWQNTLQRAAPLILTALCVALPAQAGLTIIGGEGALVLGGLAASTVPLFIKGPPFLVWVVMAILSMIAGGLWIGLSGALRHWRGVNETIASLLLAYIAIALLNHFVEGLLRDPASLNKPSTKPIGDANMLPTLPGIDVHVGLAFGVILCLILHVLVKQTSLGFATRIAGGNVRAARLAGLPVGVLVMWTCVAGGASAGLAGMVEVAAVLGSANATLVSGYGYAGILVSFIARHNPLAIIPVAILLGGIGAAGSLLQRRMGLPDAAMLVLQGMAFMFILGMETMTGRLKFFQPRGQ
jgi:simple sugar transport system permease protein